ncbi:hypothetical protein [Asaia astilbis]
MIGNYKFGHLFGGSSLSSSAASRVDPVLPHSVAARRAEDDDNEPNHPDPETGKRGKKGKKARRAEEQDDETGAEEGDDETDAEDQDDEDTAKARARERGRIAAIMSSNAAAGNPILALDLALNTRMTREEVVGTLTRTGASLSPAPATAQAETPLSQLDARMTRARTAPALSEDGHNRPDPNTPSGVAARLNAIHHQMTGR